MGKSVNELLRELDSVIESARPAVKRAATEDQNMGDKDTSHPSTSVDDQLLGDAPEGERSAENESDVTRDVGTQNINDAKESDAEKPNAMVGLTTAKATGEDPANETGSTKGVKEDGTSGHPSDLESSVQKEKYAAWRKGFEAKVKSEGFAKVATDLSNEILADIAVALDGQPASVKAAAARGAQAAEGLTKLSAEQEQILGQLEKEAAEAGRANADLLVDFYRGVVEGVAEKRAEEEAAEASSTEGEGEGAAAEEVPAESAGALPAEDLSQLAAVAEPAAAAPEMAPEAAGGDAEVLDALSQALADAGVTPEELVQAIEAEQTGVGAPIEQKMAAVNVAKTAAARVNAFRNLQGLGRIRMTKRASLDLVYKMRQMVRASMGR